MADRVATVAVEPSAQELERAAIHLNPGEWLVHRERPLATLLCSCVAVCLYDPQLRIGGMNHFLLPARNAQHYDDDLVLAGDYAMEVLRNALYAQGASPKRLVAKAFGGGNVVDSLRVAIGTRNATLAKSWLETEGIPLLAHDFGGPWARKVIFDPRSGVAFCRRIPVTRPEVKETVRSEFNYEERLQRPASATAPKIELF